MKINITTPFRRDLLALCVAALIMSLNMGALEYIGHPKNIEIPILIGHAFGFFVNRLLKLLTIALIAAILIAFLGRPESWRRDYPACIAAFACFSIFFTNMPFDEAFMVALCWGAIYTIVLAAARKITPL